MSWQTALVHIRFVFLHELIIIFWKPSWTNNLTQPVVKLVELAERPVVRFFLTKPCLGFLSLLVPTSISLAWSLTASSPSKTMCMVLFPVPLRELVFWGWWSIYLLTPLFLCCSTRLRVGRVTNCRVRCFGYKSLGSITILQPLKLVFYNEWSGITLPKWQVAMIHCSGDKSRLFTSAPK